MNTIGHMKLGLILALAITGCVTQSPAQRDSTGLQRSIYDAVPDDWRTAAESADDISPLAVSSELRDFIISNVRRTADGGDQILALTEAILDTDGVGLAYDADATHTASEAFRSGRANCLGFSNLLIAASRELGLNAEFELVSQRPRWDFVNGVLVETLHVRVTSLVSGRRMIVDFYPLPVESGYSARRLTDNEALAHHLNNLAVRHMQQGDSAHAYALMHKAIIASPRIAFVWSNLGVLLSRHQLDQLAEAAYKEALSISPQGLNALSNLQRLYLGQGRDAEAEEFIDRLEEHRARNPYYHSWLGEQAYEQGNYEQAVGHFKRAIRLKGSEPTFYMGLSKSYEKLGKKSAALRASRKALAINGRRD